MTTSICGITPCDTNINYCISGACISKNTIYYGIAGIIAFLLILRANNK